MHNQENFYSQEERGQLGRQIRWYVEHRAEVLKHGDRFLANIDLARLPKMRRMTKQKWLKQIEKVKLFYQKDLEQG